MTEVHRTPVPDSSDAGIASALNALSEAQWDTLVSLTEEVAQIGPDHAFEEDEARRIPGDCINPHYKLPTFVGETLQFLHEANLMPDFDWTDWKKFGDDPLRDPAATMVALTRYSAEDAVRLATALARTELVNDGVLGEALLSGVFLEVLARFLRWREPVL
jgi:hypothetical protein